MIQKEPLPGWMYDIKEPPSVFADDYPMVSQLVLVKQDDDTWLMSFPEDPTHIITDPNDIINLMVTFGPLLEYKGAIQVQRVELEDDDIE